MLKIPDDVSRRYEAALDAVASAGKIEIEARLAGLQKRIPRRSIVLIDSMGMLFINIDGKAARDTWPNSAPIIQEIEALENDAMEFTDLYRLCFGEIRPALADG